MNLYDIITLLVMIWAAYRGWCSGILVQLSGIGGIVLGVWLAFKFGTIIAEWLGMQGAPKFVLIALVIIATLFGVVVLCRLLTKLLTYGGVSFPIQMLGSLFSMVKVTISLSLMLLFMEYLIKLEVIRDPYYTEYLTNAHCYEPLSKVADFIFPYLTRVGEYAKSIFDSSAVIPPKL